MKTTHSTSRARLTRYVGAFALAATLAISSSASAQTYTLADTWAMVGATNNLDTSADNRGMTYAGSSNGTPVNLVLVNNKGTHAVYAYDGASGNLVTSVNSNGLSGGNFTLNKLGVTSAGQLIGANLTTSIAAGSVKIYTWPDWSQTPTTSYSSATGDALVTTLSGKRIGDSFAMTGSGTGTLLLFTIGGSNAFVLFSTTDGTTFNPTVLTVSSGLPATGSGVQIGYAFYTNNTFMLAPDGGAGKLYLIQYPSNFASLPSPVAATVIATNSSLPTGNPGNWLDFSYDAASGLLALHPNSSSPISLYTLPTNNFSGLALLASTNLSFTTSQSINGNETGDVALANTNEIYTLDTSAGLQASTINFAPAPIPPSITTQPVGGSVYVTASNFIFSVSASGTQPLTYQWQYNTVSNLATATNIAGATNNSLVLSPVTTNSSGWYDVLISNAGGETNSVAVQLTVTEPLNNASVQVMWSLPADGSQPYLDTGYNTRGLAFDPSTMTVVVAEHATANIYGLNATNGQYKFTITTPTTGLPTGSIFPVGQVGVGDDGVLYVCNVSSYQPGQQTGQNDFSIVSFPFVGDGSNPTNAPEPYQAWLGDPGNYLTSTATGNGATYSGGDRWGDSFAVRGGGTNTQILLGTYEDLNNQFGTGPGTNIAILTTSDGQNFTPTTLVITDPTQPNGLPPSGFAYLGVAWGASNTFWTKSPGYNLRQIQYDLAAGTGTVIQSFSTTAGAGSLSALDGIGLDNANNILAGVQTSDDPNDLELFQIPSLGFPPQAYYQAFFGAYNPNINGNAATTIKFPYIFSLDANNGILGLIYSVPLLPFNIATTKSAGHQVLTWQTVAGHTYQVQSTTVLLPAAWSNVGSSTTVSSSGTLSYTNTSFSGTKFFRVLAH